MMPNIVARQWFPATVALVFVVPVTWAALDNQPPVRMVGIQVPNPEVARGGSMILQVTMRRERLCPGEVFRAFVDSKETLFPINSYRFASTFGIDGRERRLGVVTIPITIDVPYAAAPGPARYQSMIQYYCNWLQRWLGYGPTLDYPVQSITIKDEVVGLNTSNRPTGPGIAPRDPVSAVRRLIPTFLEKKPEEETQP